MLDDATRMTAADPGGMLGYLHRLPDMAQGAFERGQATRLPNLRPRQVLICGMGGSAISGDLARNLFFGRSEVPIAVSRHCTLPASMGSSDLAILLSYSGNTAETTGCLTDAIARGVPCVLVTSGGQFKALAEANGLPSVAVEPGWMPRAALGELYFALLGLLSQLPGCDLDPAQAIAQLKEERATYFLSVSEGENPAKRIARQLSGKTPVVFGVHPSTEAVAMRWKAQFNENSKVTVLFGVFPELTHNEIVNLAHRPHPGHVMVLLRDPQDPPLLTRQLEFARDIMRPSLDDVIDLVAQGPDALSRQMSLSYLGDWVSVYLALMNGIDPTPVTAIFGLKDRMALAVPQEIR